MSIVQKAVCLFLFSLVVPVFSEEESEVPSSENLSFFESLLSNELPVSCPNEGIPLEELKKEIGNNFEGDPCNFEDFYFDGDGYDTAENKCKYIIDKADSYKRALVRSDETSKKYEIEKSIVAQGIYNCNCCKNPERCFYKGVSGLVEALNNTGKVSLLLSGMGFANSEISKICKEIRNFQAAMSAVNYNTGLRCLNKAKSCDQNYNRCISNLSTLEDHIDKTFSTLETYEETLRKPSSINNQVDDCRGVESKLNNFKEVVVSFKAELENNKTSSCPSIRTSSSQQNRAGTEFLSSSALSEMCRRNLQGDEEDEDLSCENPDNYNELRCQCERGDEGVNSSQCCYIDSQSVGCKDPCQKDPLSQECRCQRYPHLSECQTSCEEDPSQSFCEDEDDDNNIGDPNIPGDDTTFHPSENGKTDSPFSDLPPPPLRQSPGPSGSNPRLTSSSGGSQAGLGGGLSGGSGIPAFPGEGSPEDEALLEELLEDEELLDGLSSYDSSSNRRGGRGYASSQSTASKGKDKGKYMEKFKKMIQKPFKKTDYKNRSIFDKYDDLSMTIGCERIYGYEECLKAARLRGKEDDFLKVYKNFRIIRDKEEAKKVKHLKKIDVLKPLKKQ